MVKRVVLTLLYGIISVSLFAQNVAMAETMRSNGKIYVVVAVISVIFIGLAIYLFMLDKKISKLEKRQDK